MNRHDEFGYKTRQILNDGLNAIDSKVAVRLQQARQSALERQRMPVRSLQLAAIGHNVEFSVAPFARNVIAALALTVGAMGTYYWNAFAQAQEFEEIDSALLADELPPSAYLDRGFQAWLEHGSDSSSQ